MANLFLGVFYNLSVWYKLTNKTRYGAYIAIVGALITLVLNIVHIPKIGYVGSAWATFFCYGTMMIISFVSGHKYYPIPYNFKRLLLYPALATMFYFAGVLWVPESMVLRYALCTLYLVVFAVVAYRLDLRKAFRNR